MILEDSFLLIRTNPLLTTNVKIVVDANKKVFLDSITSNSLLNDSKYKGVIVKDKVVYEKALQNFWANTPNDVIYESRYDNDSTIMYTEYKQQYDDIYFTGSSKVINNKIYEEEFEYFAPLYFVKDKFPETFMIFRVDGSGVTDTFLKENFNSEVLSKMKVVKNIDLLDDTSLGRFNKDSFVLNDDIPTTGLDISINDTEFTRWRGIGVFEGSYLYKTKFINNVFNKECTYKEVDALLTNGFRDNNVVYPNILNYTFLFNDTPATPDYLRKWSINRYYGFYGDKKVYKKFSFYKPFRFITNYPDTNVNVTLNIDKDNCFVNTLTGELINPFYKYKSSNTYYVEYLGEFFLVKNIDNKFKIICDTNLEGMIESLNKNMFDVDSNNLLSLDLDYFNAVNLGKSYNNFFETDMYNIIPEEDFSQADVWVIEINNVFHRLVREDDKYKILSDYAFSNNQNILKYWVNATDPSYTTTIDLEKIDVTNKPLNCAIYKFKFKEVKDFDNDIIDSKSTDYEYMFDTDITYTQEPKIYKEELNSNTYPSGVDSYVYNNDVINIPCGSEYTASGELFEIIKDKTTTFDNINELWRKNQQVIKWGYMNSISHNDYSYRFNMASNHGAFNLITDITKNIPIRAYKNLDYFYNINYDFEASSNITNQSLSITRFDKDSDTILTNFDFDINEYFNGNTDYFTNFFDYIEHLDTNIKRKVKKYSLMCNGDESETNQTLFRGIKFSIYNVDSIVNNELSLKKTNLFDNYKFSVLLANKTHDIDNSFSPISNNSSFKNISIWELGGKYNTGDFVLYSWVNDLGEKIQHLYQVTTNIESADETPFPPTENNGVSGFYSDVTQIVALSDGNANSFYYNTQLTYNVSGVNYTYYKGEFYKLILNYVGSAVSGSFPPTNTTYWSKVSIFQKNIQYTTSDYFIYLGDLCKLNSNNEIVVVQAVTMKTNTVPTKTIFMFNNNMFVSMVDSVLDNGICFYINKKFKNVLLHIYFNDNIVDIKNINRDDMYNLLYNNLTANNVIGNINNLTFNGFVNDIKYYIIDETGTTTITDKNNLIHVIKCDVPNQISVRNNSLRINTVSVDKNLISINNNLKYNEIADITQLNWYDGSPLGVTFYNNLDNDFYTYYRYNGHYSPIFLNVELFSSSENYLFEPSLTFFGMSSELVISKVGSKNFFDNVKYTAIYPQVDNVGYSVINQYVFNGSWSNNFYKKYSK